MTRTWSDKEATWFLRDLSKLLDKHNVMHISPTELTSVQCDLCEGGGEDLRIEDDKLSITIVRDGLEHVVTYDRYLTDGRGR